MGEVATALSAACGGPEPVVTGEYRLGDVRHITASSSRLRKELGWLPRVPFADGVREFAKAPRAAGRRCLGKGRGRRPRAHGRRNRSGPHRPEAPGV